ncbi:glutaminase A [Jeotgalibacillus proteolyticus]|uniref:Glutaminase n=1 Tax=Jeotgalibacillus proteolyticus TaxID=2082395 RepID=A0A2S5GD53_9BACL|nr:glutaminase A [Jeotgalibacillus proteolyticus]PPA70926.1 glutaminase A [Jeotgalibacillus proteolyticus]
MTKLSNEYIEEIVKACRPFAAKGNVIDHIPGLDQSSLTDLGVTIVTLDGETYSAGEDHHTFSFQSISKVITLLMALEDFGKDIVFQKVGMEPTDDFFNSISNLEDYEGKRPYNPLINSGAIATASLIKGGSVDERFDRVLSFLQKITENKDINMNQEVYDSEVKNGSRNKALAYFMESTGVLSNQESDDALDLYHRMNSIEINSLSLAKIGCFLSNHGRLIGRKTQLIQAEHVRTVKAIMLMAGMYNESGTYAVEVGFPLKSGVSGGIVGSVPGSMGIGIIGPAINKKGNSCAGGEALRILSRDLMLNIFHDKNVKNL